METPYKGNSSLDFGSPSGSYDKCAPDTPDILQLIPPSLVILSGNGKKDVISPIVAASVFSTKSEKTEVAQSGVSSKSFKKKNTRRRLLSDPMTRQTDEIDMYLQRLQNNPMFGELSKILAEECLHMQTPTNLINVSWEPATREITRQCNIHVAHLNLQKRFLQFRSQDNFQAAALEIESRYSKEVSKLEINRYIELSQTPIDQANVVHENFDKSRMWLINDVTKNLKKLSEVGPQNQSLSSRHSSPESVSFTVDNQSDSGLSSGDTSFDFQVKIEQPEVDVLGMAMAAADVLPENNDSSLSLQTSNTHIDVQCLIDTFPIPRQDVHYQQQTENTMTVSAPEHRSSMKRKFEINVDIPAQAHTEPSSKKPRTEVNPSKPRQITPEATRVLTEWYDNHVQYPYPAGDDVAYLVNMTKLSSAQVKKWMANKRVRCFNTLSITGNKHPIKNKLGGKRKAIDNNATYKQLSELSRKVLSDWYDSHSSHPYPTEAEKEELATDAGITVTQVKSWFANRRSREANRRRQVPNYFLEKFPEYSSHVRMVQVHRDQTRRRLRPEQAQGNFENMYY